MATEIWIWHDQVLAMREYRVPFNQSNRAYYHCWAYISPNTGEVFARYMIEGPLRQQWIPWSAYDLGELQTAPPSYRRASLFSSWGDITLPKAVKAHHFLRAYEIYMEPYLWNEKMYKLRA